MDYIQLEFKDADSTNKKAVQVSVSDGTNKKQRYKGLIQVNVGHNSLAYPKHGHGCD
jgi:hypothetical protein